jgi:hypothetical protein
MVIQRLSEELDIPSDVITKCIFYHHYLKSKLSDKSELTKIDLDMSDESFKLVRDMAKKLHITTEAVLGGLMLHTYDKVVSGEKIPGWEKLSKKTKRKGKK